MAKRDSSIASYMKIRRYVLTLIQKANGKMVPLPSIIELAEMFQVSRPTVTRAMKALTDDGFATGKRGIGSFTNPRKECYYLHMPIVGLLMGDGQLVHFDKYLSHVFAHLMMATSSIPAVVHVVSLSSSKPDIIFKEIKNEQLNALVWHGIGSSEQEEIRNRLMDSGIPVVASDAKGLKDGKASVRFGMKELGYACGKRLIEEGRRNLAFLPSNGVWGLPLEGIREAYEEAGLSLNPNFFMKDPNECLDEFRKLLSYQAPIDAVFNGLFMGNEIEDILKEFNVDLADRCRLIENSLCVNDLANFHGFVYEFPFQKHAEQVASLTKRALAGESLPQDEAVVDLNLKAVK